MCGVFELRVLGPLEVVVDGTAVPLPGRKHPRLLAALAVGDGHACSIEALTDAVWGETPPRSARKLLQLYVSQLRKVVPEGAIRTTESGYALDVNDGSIDAERFELLAREAGGALARGNPALTTSLAGRALALWRGPAYEDVMYEDFVRADAERLEELRLGVSEDRLDAQLRLGRHKAVLAEVLALAAQHTLRERLQALAMVALYRSGRQTDALDRYADVRRQLDEELGLEPGPQLRALQQRILRQDPELDTPSSSDRSQSTLPIPPNRLVGRASELAQLREILARRESRLVVLTGAGGTGKTRLAFEAAHQAATSFANGAVIVELAPLHDPKLVAATIAQALDVAEVAGEGSEESLARVLADRELLLVLDNAEHLRDAAPLFARLVSRAPRLTVVVTSRAVLHISGEQVFPVAPLPEDDAVELFLQRARLLDSSFEISDVNEQDVREICRRLDGLPLAIELAAARIRTLTPRAIVERLGKRLALLTSGPRDLPARQQTLRETIEWSVGLLSEMERGIFLRLAVFPGGATLEAAEAVCGADVNTIEALVNCHVVRRIDVNGAPRFGLLETIREYAAERLVETGDRDTVRRHAEWCIELAEAAEPELSGDQQADWFATLEAEHDNFRAALEYLDATRQGHLQLRLVTALSRFLYVRGHLVEARRLLEQALSNAEDEPPLLRRRALTAASANALLQGDYPAATNFAQDALDAARQSREPRFVANALSNLGAIVLAAGDHTRAAIVLEEAVAGARAAGDTRIAALAINNLGDLALTTGDYLRARPLFEESHGILEARGDTANLARSLFNQGAVDFMLGDRERARARFREGLLLAREADDKEDTAWCLEGLAAVAAWYSEGHEATILLGAASALLTQIGADYKPFERQLHETTRRRAESLCGPAGHVEAHDEGATMPLDDAVDLALRRSALPLANA
jgi:predicted ATPase/DNA-binding SARP family transcriptional activator